MVKVRLLSVSIAFRLSSVVLMLLLTLPTITFADVKKQLIDEVFALSGVDSLFVQLPLLIESTFNQMEAQKVDARIGEVKQAMSTAFSPRKLRTNAVEYINKNVSIEQLKYIRNQLRAPLARKVTALENEANNADSVSKMMAYAQQLQKHPPSESRIGLIAELINASNAVESSLAVRTEFFRGFMEAASQLDPIEKRMSREEIDNEISALRSAMEESTAQEVIIAFLYTYKSLTNRELKSYIQMYEHEYMTLFTTEINKAIAYSFRSAGKKMMKKMSSKLRTS